MIQWTTKLYIGDKMKKKKNKAINSISNSKATFNVYCIAFASNPSNLFDIMDANELLFPHYRNLDVCIVGLAEGKAEAIELIREMLMEEYQETGNFNVRTYFT